MHLTKSNNKPKVLIAEDEVLITSFYKQIINMHFNCIVHVVHDPESAVEKAKQVFPDVFIMDLTFDRKLDGLDAVINIREFSGAPVIYVTGHLEEQTRAKAMKYQPCTYLTKPIHVPQLLDEMNKHIDFANTSRL